MVVQSLTTRRKVDVRGIAREEDPLDTVALRLPCGIRKPGRPTEFRHRRGAAVLVAQFPPDLVERDGGPHARRPRSPTAVDEAVKPRFSQRNEPGERGRAGRPADVPHRPPLLLRTIGHFAEENVRDHAESLTVHTGKRHVEAFADNASPTIAATRYLAVSRISPSTVRIRTVTESLFCAKSITL